MLFHLDAVVSVEGSVWSSSQWVGHDRSIVDEESLAIIFDFVTVTVGHDRPIVDEESLALIFDFVTVTGLILIAHGCAVNEVPARLSLHHPQLNSGRNHTADDV